MRSMERVDTKPVVDTFGARMNIAGELNNEASRTSVENMYEALLLLIRFSMRWLIKLRSMSH